MEIHTEKRRYPRYDHSSPIFLHRVDNQDQYYFAQMSDYGRGGLSLLTTEKLVVGHLVYLEMKNYDKTGTGPEKFKSYRGCVKWVAPYSSDSADAKGSYRYGIEYSEPVGYEC